MPTTRPQDTKTGKVPLHSQGLTLAGLLIRQKREAAMAGTLEASWFVVADLAAAPILLATLIDIWT